MKKLTIDRSLRTDLFGHGTQAALPSPERERQPGILKKKVSFDASTVGGSSSSSNTGQPNGASEDTSATPSPQEQGLLRSPQPQPPNQSNGVSTRADSEPVRGNELAIVPEDDSLEVSDHRPAHLAKPQSKDDPKPGAYWMKPTKEQIQKLSKEDRQHLKGFSVGRYGCGKVEFNQPVDINSVNLNDIYETVVLIVVRSVTVYPDGARKPPRGKGLNVPSTISLENSWPRQRDQRTPLDDKSGLRFNKHVDRLRKVANTEFVDYERDTGTWIFKVAHFTTYSFDYDEEASEGDSLHLNDSFAMEAPETPTPTSRQGQPKSTLKIPDQVQPILHMLDDMKDQETSVPSANGFGRIVSTAQTLPGSFDELALSYEDSESRKIVDDDNEDDLISERGNLSSSTSVSAEDEPRDIEDQNADVEAGPLVVSDDHADLDMQMDMAGAYPDQGEKQDEDAVIVPMSHVSGDWTLDLLQTMGSNKRDRQQLRAEGRLVGNDKAEEDLEDERSAKRQKPIFATSIDLMNSLFGLSPIGTEQGKGALKHQGGGGGHPAKEQNVSRAVGVAKV